jgi:hypothetical protein
MADSEEQDNISPINESSDRFGRAGWGGGGGRKNLPTGQLSRERHAASISLGGNKPKLNSTL